MPSYSVRDIAEHCAGKVAGDETRHIRGVKPLESAGPGDLSLLTKDRYREAAVASRAGAIFARPEAQLPGKTLIHVADPREAMRLAIELLYPAPITQPFISEFAKIHPEAMIGSEARIEENVVIGPGAKIGDRATIMAAAVIREGCVIGNDVTIHPGAVVYPGSVIGDRVKLFAHSVIGAEGFGFAQSANGAFSRIRHVGRAIIGDDVEVGAHSVIERGSIADTIVGRGSKIHSFVIVAHNVQIGEDCLVVAHVAFGGSSKIGNRTRMYAKSALAEHVAIGSDCRLLADTISSQNWGDGMELAGFPAMPAARWRRVMAATRKLPDLLKGFRPGKM